MIVDIVEQRKQLSLALDKVSIVNKVYPSDANFLLVKVKAARKCYEYLLEKGIVVRDRSNIILCEDCLRITIGTQNENQALLDALKHFNP
jgi:histidinol-phosphate aminotransferase